MRGRKRLLAGLLAILMAFAGLSLYSMKKNAAESGDYQYVVSEDGASLTITKYTGSGGAVVIPSEMDGKKVTSIGHGAFSDCIGLSRVEIPRGVIEIEDSAFSGCSGLESIKVAEGNGTYDSREDCNAIIQTETNELLCGCKNTKIPESVTSIGGFAFCGCSRLSRVEIPGSVRSIGDYAFLGCSKSLIIYGFPSSEAGRHAKENSITFEIIAPAGTSTRQA